MKKRKCFEELTIQDDFMFCKVLQNMDICKQVLELVLQEENISITNVTSQHTIENNSGSKSVRLDVLVEDSKKDSFDVEMQLVENDDIPKRMRIYQASIDISKLIKGKRYKDTTNTVIIFFCMFDPIGKGLPIYTFENICRENKDIVFNDGTLKVIVNVKAYKKVSNPELRGLLKYIYDGSVTTSLTKEIDMTLAEIKKNHNVLDEYISMYTRMQDERDEGIKEGEKRGIRKGMAQGMAQGMTQGILTTATRMKKAKFDVSTIIEMTGLSREEIEKL